ncbi:DUF805 domain-containing protein [Pseudomonas sp. NPDC096917]|uniref:DUF805 domain-containing protein n=1 Tax=Pseudomonas sp. NPDC096917 TaxID=3364483 RepID=UPI00383A802C
MPEPSLEHAPQEAHFAPLAPLGFTGRVGRLRLLVWNTVLTLIAMLVSVLVLLAVKVSPTLGITCGATLSIAYLLIILRISAQRLHDLNWSAWMLLLHLVPVANLVLTLLMLLMPGTPGPNKYGPPPPPNSQSVTVMAWIIIFLIGLSICVMIALFALGLMAALINAVNGNTL